MCPMLSTSYQSPKFTLTSDLPIKRSLHPPHPAAGRLHLDALWWTAGAETSEREIYRRACCVRSSRLPSLPQASRLYDLPPPHASTHSLLMPTEQGRSTPSSVKRHGRAVPPFLPGWWLEPCSCLAPADFSCGNSCLGWKSPRRDATGDPTGPWPA